jgi:fructokinase
MRNKIIGVGEVLWDMLPSGPQLGGAPANFIYHAQALGADAELISRVGGDALGDGILSRLSAHGVGTLGIQIDDIAPTGTVSVTLSNGQPQYIIHENVAWDFMKLRDDAFETAQNADAICFGSLAQRNPVSRGTIQELVAAVPKEAFRVFDINLRQHFYTEEIVKRSLVLANVLKLNDAELPPLAKIFGLTGTPKEQLKQLAEIFRLRLVALTRGENGSLLYSGGRWSDHPGFTVVVKDTIGAGDAFTASLVTGLLTKMDLDTINERANQLACYVCSQEGAMPCLPEPVAVLYSLSSKKRCGAFSLG